MLMQCRNCPSTYTVRVGRGLCRVCWNDQLIREKYPVIAPFGSKEAGDIFRTCYRRKIRNPAMRKAV